MTKERTRLPGPQGASYRVKMNRRDQILKKRGHSRRLLSVLLALVMLLSLLPTAVFAADPAPQTFKKVTSAEELVTGQYVLVDEKGFSPKELSGKWVTTAAVTVNGATATASEGIWTITVSADGVVLTDANNVSIAPSGGNNNGIKSAATSGLLLLLMAPLPSRGKAPTP